MSEHDATDAMIAGLPEGPIDPAFAARVEHAARAALVAEGRPLLRFDRFAMERLVPIALSLCAMGYAAFWVRALGMIYLA